MRRSAQGWMQTLFGLRVPVPRATYATTGLLLALLKYGLDAGAVYLAAHRVWTPLDYLSPLLSAKTQGLGARGWILWAMAAWTLPFLWVGLSMSVRRAADAGLSAWLGLMFLAPGLNYVLMLALCLLPSRPQAPWTAGAAPEGAAVGDRLRSALLGAVAGLALALAMTALSVYGLGRYGSALFLGTPVLMGAASGFLYNRGHARTVRSTLGVGAATAAITGGALLLFALEGAVCVLMAAPLALAASLAGALVGRAIALRGSPRLAPLVVLLLALPGLAAVEPTRGGEAAFEVESEIVIAAPPERVWAHVIGFSELPPPGEWLFRAGVAYPQRARIEGRGVGAVRRCEFSTGAFVEPITAWEPPTRLAFDVVAQPPPMQEWSPYRLLHPPHLDGYFRSRRGEFRLIALPGGRTRLEGRTWYALDILPRGYFRLLADALVRTIHERVLEHVRRETEADGAEVSSRVDRSFNARGQHGQGLGDGPLALLRAERSISGRAAAPP